MLTFCSIGDSVNSYSSVLCAVMLCAVCYHCVMFSDVVNPPPPPCDTVPRYCRLEVEFAKRAFQSREERTTQLSADSGTPGSAQNSAEQVSFRSEQVSITSEQITVAPEQVGVRSEQAATLHPYCLISTVVELFSYDCAALIPVCLPVLFSVSSE